MTIYYIDTSAIVKRYHAETGTEVVDKLLDEPSSDDRCYTSFLSVLELTSSVVRLAKGRQLREKMAHEVIARFRQDLHDIFRIWPLDDQVVSAAIPVIERYGLRSADALHLATALSIFAFAGDMNQVMVSSDTELLQAATLSKITALDPQDENALDTLLQLRTHK